MLNTLYNISFELKRYFEYSDWRSKYTTYNERRQQVNRQLSLRVQSNHVEDQQTRKRMAAVPLGAAESAKDPLGFVHVSQQGRPGI